MKSKILFALILVVIFSTNGFAQATTAIPSSSDTTGITQRRDLNNRGTYQSANGTKQSFDSTGASATTYTPGASSQAKTTAHHPKKSTKKPMYRDTRLGSSEKQYNTYKKNDNGAGAITTSPK